MCIWKWLWWFGHSWQELGLAVDGVYLLFRRPMGKAKILYCERCGKMKLVGIKEGKDG